MIEQLRQEPFRSNPLVDALFMLTMMIPLTYAGVSFFLALLTTTVAYFSFVSWQMKEEKEFGKEKRKTDFMKTEHEKVMDTEPMNEDRETSRNTVSELRGSGTGPDNMEWEVRQRVPDQDRDEEYWSDPANHQTRTAEEGTWEYEQLQEMRETIEERRQRRREELEERQEAMMRGIEDNDTNYWY